MKKSLGIYIHVPFCLKKCRYCDFCSFVGKDGQYMSAYADELCRRISAAAAEASEYSVDTVYFGGGTPSLMPIESLEKITDAVRFFGVADDAEITLECNPATADGAYFRGLVGLGVNRLSIGLQSAHDGELALLGRAHTKDDFVRCFEDARAAGFDNISADLMYGIPDQTLDSFSSSLEFLVALSPEHISAYGLTIEEGTYFDTHRAQLTLADDDGQADMYSLMGEILEKNGYHKYEISNFSKEGRESRHNMRYWKCLDYLGFGVAAHSCFGGRRFGNSRDIAAFLRDEDITEECCVVDADERRREYVMLGLRLCEGIDLTEYARRFGGDFFEHYPEVRSYIDGGFMRTDGRRTAFTERGFLVSNAILSDLL